MVEAVAGGHELSSVRLARYNGAPWRSRFLRGPKTGLELAGRSDFVELGNPVISVIRLGLKTGADSFFFMEATGEPTTASRISVRGLGGFTAEIPVADLVPGIQSPKDFDTPQGRAASVPSRRGRYSGGSYYLFPRANRLDRRVREYVEYGQARGVNAGHLVRLNAESSDAWYRQTRNQVRSRWVLPYNSGYDYGAVDNAIGAVLNGRLVGVEPAAEIDPLILGGILNSTFVTLMRLLEGVATGNEGAFDVGPPAARVMRVPDPRKMSDDGAAEVADVMQEILDQGILPHAPLADATVPALRERLDLAVIMALGEGRGDASVVVDRVYRSYARWRGAVEAVEDKMQEHRRALTRRGGSRAENPAISAARTVWDEMSPVTPSLLTGLIGEHSEVVNPQFLAEGDPNQGALFDQTVVLDGDGAPLDLGDVRRLELARYVRGLGLAGPFPLPSDPSVCVNVLDSAATAESSFIEEAARRARAHVSDDLIDQVVTYSRRAWLAKSIAEVKVAVAPSSVEEVGEGDEQDPSLFDTEGMVPPVDPEMVIPPLSPGSQA